MFKLEYMVVGNVNFSELTFFLVETMFWSNWIQLLIFDILDDEITYAFFFIGTRKWIGIARKVCWNFNLVIADAIFVIEIVKHNSQIKLLYCFSSWPSLLAMSIFPKKNYK